jgi:hypothetical protein
MQTEQSKPMASTEARSFDTTALTQSCGVSQRCANPFCKGAGVVMKTPRGKHGRYCSDPCRMDGYVLRRARAMMDEVGIIEFTRRLEGRAN